MTNPHETLNSRRFEGKRGSGELRKYLTPARNFSQVQFSEIAIRNIESERMCFTYCTFNDCKFVSSELVEGCTFINCEFVDVDLSSCDMKTCKTIGCKFESCCFKGALFSRNQFNSTVFHESDIGHTVVMENISTETSYLDCATTQMTASLNEYISCQFVNFAFTDGTFAYQVLWNCKFESCIIGWATLGITYGLNTENLVEFKLVHYFSELNDLSSDEALQFIIEQFEKSDNIYRALVVSANFGVNRNSSLLKLISYIAYTANRSPLPVRHEEILFFRLLLKYEYQYRALPLLTVSSIKSQISSVCSGEWNDFCYLDN